MTGKQRKSHNRQAKERGDKLRAMSLRYAGMTPKPKAAVVQDEPPKGTYAAYLASPEWKMRRIQIMSKRGAKCERCGARRTLQIHHKTYARLGRELPEDLEILCRKCHETEHGLHAGGNSLVPIVLSGSRTDAAVNH